MQVIHFVRDLDVASGGPSRSVPALAKQQSEHDGIEVAVIYRDRGNPVVDLPDSKVCNRAMGPGDLLPGKFMLKQGIIDSVPNGECIFHIHGLWSPTLHFAAKLARRKRIPYVVSTRGMLAQWAFGHKGFRKRVAWQFYQEKDLVAASCLVASSEFEQNDVRDYLPESKIVVIPNGCEQPSGEIEMGTAFPGERGIRWALAIGRLHPVKGYAELIEAWASLKSGPWKLAIAGPDEAGYRSVLEKQIETHSLTDRVFLLGEINEAEKRALLHQSELFVAPSKTENFGMAIAEAMQSGTPVITTKGTPWRELIDHDCGWWVESDVVAIGNALERAINSEPASLSAMGERGHQLIREKYSWDQVAKNSIELYRGILDGL